VLLIQEEPPDLPRPEFWAFAGAELATVPVAPGEQEFQASITVTYGIGTTAANGR
jgi:uncharacterized protein YggE